MASELRLPKYSVGVGDRFAHQAKAQLAACVKAKDAGIEGVAPVWNKSNRESTRLLAASRRIHARRRTRR